MGGYHTQYEPCSGQGTCNEGTCECYPGFEGDACQRANCPNSCSNAGQCLPLVQIAENIKDMNSLFYGDYMSSLSYTGAFDASVPWAASATLAAAARIALSSTVPLEGTLWEMR